MILASDDIEVTLRPEQGCDIVSLVDRSSGIELMFKPPWRARGTTPPATQHVESRSQMLERYPGGWQVLLPNGGPACVENGVEWGFHGEACLLPWEVLESGPARARFSVDLFRAPLTVERSLEVAGPRLMLEETVRNTSPDPVEVMWSHHPAFGAPFLEGGCLLTTGARTLIADDVAPGTLLAPGSRHPWPNARSAAGAALDLGSIPSPDERRDHLAYLTDFDDGFFAFTNPRLGLGFALRWPIDVFPHAWFWQEVHSLPGFPWYRRAYVTAVEPCTTFPGQGLTAARAKGGTPLTLAGGESRTVVLEGIVFHDHRPVRALGSGGALEFAS